MEPIFQGALIFAAGMAAGHFYERIAARQTRHSITQKERREGGQTPPSSGSVHFHREGFERADHVRTKEAGRTGGLLGKRDFRTWVQAAPVGSELFMPYGETEADDRVIFFNPVNESDMDKLRSGNIQARDITDYRKGPWKKQDG